MPWFPGRAKCTGFSPSSRVTLLQVCMVTQSNPLLWAKYQEAKNHPPSQPSGVPEKFHGFEVRGSNNFQPLSQHYLVGGLEHLDYLSIYWE